MSEHPLGGFIPSNNLKKVELNKNFEKHTVKCFSLFDMLQAVGRTMVDYFSLDVEGHELGVLKSIPWDKVTINGTVVQHILVNVP